MKKNITLLLLFVVVIFSQQTIIAQVKTKIYANGIPKELRKTNFKISEVFVPEPSSFDALLKARGETESSIEYKNKFAVPVKVDYDLMQLAQKDAENNIVSYTLKLIASKSLNLSLKFSEFELSKNSILSISTDFEITDSITSKENNPHETWATRVYQGNFIYLSLSIPKSEINLTKIKIDQINLGFVAVGGGFFGNPGQSATCNINVLCPQGNGWENEKNSVALIVSGGGEICTGTLVMNTCGSNIPYLLTANHCLNSNIQNWVFQFQTWSNTCNPNGTFREDVQFNGCQLRANNAATDFALVELNQTPPANSGINYSGWDRNNTPATSGSSIHHPQGDLMKISLYNQQAISVPWISGGSNHWIVSFNQDIVQHGSSGSALYNQNRRLVGQLHGNQNNVCPNPGTNNCWCVTQIPSIGEYGRFDLSWTGGGTNATRLSNWLDPNNTGAMTTNTTNVSALVSPNGGSLSIVGDASICSGTKTYTLQNNGIQFTGNVSWTSSNLNIASIPPSGNPVTLTKVSSGTVTITATVACGISTTKTVKVGVPDINNFNFLVSGPSCISYNNQSMSFGVGFNSNWGCQLNALAGITEVQWQVICSNPHQVTYNAGTYTCQFPSQVNKAGLSVAFSYPTQPYVITFLFRVKNTCGWSEWSPGNTQFIQACGGGWRFVASPNPTDGTIQIALDEETLKNDKSSDIREIQVMDKFGKVVKQFKYSSGNKRATINMSELRTDVYFIKVFNGKEWKGQSVIKQ